MLRWTTLLFAAANMAFIAVYSSLSESPTITDVVAAYGNGFLSAAFAKSDLRRPPGRVPVFYFTALWPHRHPRRIYDKLVIPACLTSALASRLVRCIPARMRSVSPPH